MTDEPKEDAFLTEVENSVRKLLKSKNKAERLSAVGHAVKLLAIKHRITGGDDKTGFFDK
jgi:ribosomal protein S6E (S10)